jgi:DNA end-binding protein Ku
MPRATSKATLGFGLVSIPVSLYKSTDDKSIRFVQLHKGCGGRVRQPKVCETCGTNVEQVEIIKGYETDKDNCLELSDADFEGLPIGDPDTIEIVEFVSTKLDPREYTGTVYFATPQKGAGKAFGLLRTALEAEGKTAIVRLTLRSKQHLAELSTFGNSVLTLSLLRYADELRDLAQYEQDLPEVSEKELEIARQLIDKLTTPEFSIAHYVDEYRQALEKRIEEKLAGGIITTQVEATTKEPTENLLDTLIASVEAAGVV